MTIIRYDQPNFDAALRRLTRRAQPSGEVEKAVSEIVSAVRERGDAALINYTLKFGGPALSESTLRVNPAEFRTASRTTSTATKDAIALAHANVRDFAKRSLRKNWSGKNHQGVRVGERFEPFQRVGIYVPGGTAPLVSTAVMTCTLAQTAGVLEIAVTTPADKAGNVNPALLHALQFSGATEVYKIGGAQAVAALAYGTKTIAPVLKIFGPGNAYVVEAKRQVFGQVAVDLLPGPSEIMIIGDQTANAAWIAADMLAQAEHGRGSAVVLVTTSAKLLDQVRAAIDAQTMQLSRAAHLASVLEENTSLVLVKSLKDAVAIANDFAPEHLSIATKDEERIAAQIRTAGAIFLGKWSPVAGGDFVAGPSHELPTGGAGKSFAGLTVDQFQRRTSIVRFDKPSLRRSLPALTTFSAIEGLDAHGRSAAIRLQ